MKNQTETIVKILTLLAEEKKGNIAECPLLVQQQITTNMGWMLV